MPQIRSCSMSDGSRSASTASTSVVALPVVDPGSWPRVSSLSPPRLNPHPVEPPRRLVVVVAGQKRIFNFEPGHDSGVHRVLLDETLKKACWAFCERLVSLREVRRRVVTRSNRDGAA